MRKVLGALVVLVAWVGLSACTPTPTVTANPSTIKPACEQVTTVTGKLTPATYRREVVLEMQRTDGVWTAWRWFENADDGMGAIYAKVNQSTGAYSLTYLAPNISSYPTTRLRVRTGANDAPVVSKSWYVTRPTGC